MKNTLFFLSLTLLFTLPVHAENPVDPTTWGSDSPDDEFDPNAQSVIKELYNAARSRLSTAPTSHTEKPNKEEDVAPTKLEQYLENEESIQARKQMHIECFERAKSSCRFNSIGGIATIGGAIGARYFEKITTLPAVIIGACGLAYVAYNEAKVKMYKDYITQQKEKDFSSINKKTK